MKKLLVLLTLVVGILALSASAFAQCSSCKGTVRNVPCLTVTQATACDGFDYDGNVAAVTNGYCTALPAGDKYKAIFHICDCAEAAKFVAGFTIDIRMSVLVDGVVGAGAYWTNGPTYPAVTAIGFSTAASSAAACALASPAVPPAGHHAAFTGAIVYTTADGITPATPSTVATCAVATTPVNLQASVLTQTGVAGAGAYVLTGLELPYWAIDIPPIRIDPTVVASGATVQVKIELIDHAGAGICPSCSLCDCTIDVAKVCCGAGTGSMLFPYFTSLTAHTYWNGIAIINKTGVAGTATLTAYEKDGGVGTYAAAVPADGMFVDLLENITWTVVSGTLGGSPCFIEVTTNYGNPDGFAMISNYTNQESMGYIPSKPAAAVGLYP